MRGERSTEKEEEIRKMRERVMCWRICFRWCEGIDRRRGGGGGR